MRLAGACTEIGVEDARGRRAVAASLRSSRLGRRARAVASSLATASFLLLLPACSTFHLGQPTSDDVERVQLGTMRALVAQEAPNLPPDARREIAGLLVEAQREHGLDPYLVMAVIAHESDWRPTAVAPGGSIGLLQIQPVTGQAVARELGIPWRGTATLRDPVQNVRIGLAYLAELHEQFDQNQRHALAAYNVGPGRVEEILRRGRQPLNNYSSAVLRERDRIAENARILSGSIAGL
ncbi:MAG TPA: lytic transglycosylase domain-containing protein [Myxococcota bacterium]|jgi:soluble lytic murein transglycosylase-like protein|nr:lytic transglycosylase domain-containing protein [Myxococcota bacterium]